MQGLHYRAIDDHGRVHQGYTLNNNRAELAQLLDQRGWQQLPVSGLQRLGNALGIGPRLPQWPKSSASLFTLHLSQLLAAGVTLLHSLDELAALEGQKSSKIALLDVKCRVDRGEAFSDALATYPGMFGSDYVAAVRAGEASGELSVCLRQQADNLQWQAELSERFKTVLTYPLFALVCLLVVFLFVLLYLVPAMSPLLSMSIVPLPRHTQWLIGLSESIRQSGVAVLLIASILCITLILLWRSENALKWHVQSILLRGGYGQIFTQFTLARYSRTVSLLYESGVDITDAMRISQNMVNIALLQKQLEIARAQILAGESIARAMQAQPGLPRLFVRMVAAGEQAGVIGVALRQCADQLQSSAQYSLDRTERLIGPVLLCVLGGLLLWVALSVLGPIYSAVEYTGTLP